MMPTKGIPLPFISYGGSSLLVMLLATGVLLNISQQARLRRRDGLAGAEAVWERRRRLKLLIAGGGTGGHVFPALAVAREWLRGDADREVVFVGTQRGMEARLVPEAGLPLETIRSAGLKGIGRMRLARNLREARSGDVGFAAILRRHNFAPRSASAATRPGR